MIIFYCTSAYEYYKKSILNEEEQSLHKKRNIHYLVPHTRIEVFGGELVNENGNGKRFGWDLENYDVKSSKFGYHFGFDYYCNNGPLKLKEGVDKGYIFFSYNYNYRDVQVRFMEGIQLKAEYFDVWEPEFQKLEEHKLKPRGKRGKLALQKRVEYEFVEKNGVLVMEIKNGNLIYSINSLDKSLKFEDNPWIPTTPLRAILTS